MVVLLEEIEVAVEIERRRRVLPHGHAVAVILEVTPVVRPDEQDSLARAVGEVPGVGFQAAERPGSVGLGPSNATKPTDQENDPQAQHVACPSTPPLEAHVPIHVDPPSAVTRLDQ